MNIGGGLREYLRLVRRWWWLLVVSTIIPMVVSYYFTSQQPDLYQAQATIMVGTSLFQDPDPDPWQMNLSDTLANFYAEMLRQGPVIEAVISRLGLDRTPEQLATQIRTWVHSNAQLLEIQVTDTNPEAAALIANALAEELIRRSPTSGGNDPEQQAFIQSQLEELQAKIESVSAQINDLTASLSELTSAAEIQEAQERIAALEEVKSTYQSTYASLLDLYRTESPNVLSLFDPAVVPQWPIPSKAKLIVAVAGAAGLGLALGAIFLMEYLDTSFRWEGDGVQSVMELPVLGVVPQTSRKEALLASNPLSPVAEGIRAIRANIFLMRPDQPFRTLLLTSPSSSEGKSFVLVNLAIGLASAGHRVVVVDADIRRPSLHEFLDRPNVTGLADVLTNRTDGEEEEKKGKGREKKIWPVPLQETDFDNLRLLSAGRPRVDSTTLLTSPRLSTLLEILREQGDIILIDSPPVLGPPDATVLATLVEGTILVVGVGITKRELIRQARDQLLAQPGVNLLGLTVNRAKLDGSYYYYGLGRESGEPRQIGQEDGRAWLTLGEAATYLGISKAMARRWCKMGRLTTRRAGLRLRVSRDDVEHLMQVPVDGAEAPTTNL